jgi:hypothetical protein
VGGKESTVRNIQQRRISLREQGKRRVRHLTQVIAVAGGALAALFGIAFTRDASAVTPATPAPPATGSTQSTSPPAAPGDPDTDGDNSQTTAPAPPVIQPPAEVPQHAFGGGGHVRSRSTP